MSKGKVKSLYFCVMSAEEIEALSVLEIKSGKSVAGGINDPRLGPVDDFVKCPTCSQKNTTCVGHFGHINLAVPIIHPKYFNTIVKILRCICIGCKRTLISKEKVDLSFEMSRTKGTKRLDRMVEKCKSISICPYCSFFNHMIKSDNNKKIYIDTKESNILLDATEIRKILECISNDEFALLGFNMKLPESPNVDFKDPAKMLYAKMSHRHQIRPEDFVLTKFLIAPLCMRPPSFINGEYFPDDLTEKLSAIVKLNEKLKSGGTTNRRGKAKEYGELERKKDIEKLEENIAIYIHNKNGIAKAGRGNSRNSEKPACKGICDRLEGKEGQIRKAVFSKRNNYTARTVIGGDPTLNIDELGVPAEMCEELTTPHVVRPYNRKRIEALIREGKVNYIYDNIRLQKINLHKIDYKNYTIKQDIHDPAVFVIVDVQLRDGDVVVFNRQPTLRKESMMTLKTKVMPEGKTFRFSLALCSAFNADFDGDDLMRTISY